MRYERKYDRIAADRLFEWENDEWIIDPSGNLMVDEEPSDEWSVDAVIYRAENLAENSE